MNFVIDKIDGLQLEFSKLVSMMNYARYTTLQAVEGLTIENLDYLYDEEANSIGMLLYHMAAIEFYYQIHTFEDREPTEAELERWLPAIELGDLGREKIKGNAIEFYINTLQKYVPKRLRLFNRYLMNGCLKRQTFGMTNKQITILSGFTYLKMRSTIADKFV